MTNSEYTISFYGGDVGGIDEDYYAPTLEKARWIAVEDTLPGTRGTEIYDPSGRLVEVVGA